MRDILTVFVITIAAVLIGVGLWLYGPDLFHQVPTIDESQTHSASEKEEVSFVQLARGDRSGITTQKNVAVFSEAEMQKLLASVYGANIPALPSVDFGMQYVIGVFGGEQPTGGHEVEVQAITDTDSERMVAIVHTRPGSGCVTTQTITTPFQLVVVPYSDLPPVHEDFEAISSCN